jgi:hypothetical protein
MIKAVLAGCGAIVAIGSVIVFGQMASTVGVVATAPSRVINKTLGTDNIISNYEWYHDSNAAFIARVAQIHTFKQMVSDEKDPVERSRLRIDLAAQQQTCRTLATNYNANSQKINKNIFKGTSLPETQNIEECN